MKIIDEYYEFKKEGGFSLSQEIRDTFSLLSGFCEENDVGFSAGLDFENNKNLIVRVQVSQKTYKLCNEILRKFKKGIEAGIGQKAKKLKSYRSHSID